MTGAEFSRPIRLDTLGAGERTESIAADEGERVALARRFGLVALDALSADLSLRCEGDDVVLSGRLRAQVTQSCVASGAPVAAEIDEPITLVFRPAPVDGAPDEEIELAGDELDIVFHDGATVDVGEAVAQSLALALDPYPRAPGADAALKAAAVKSEIEAGPFGALAGLRDKLKP